MQVYALVGPSGTGKSHRASYLAFKYEISLIVDDGLLIGGTSILAGKSAKRETTRFGAVKRAIFQDEKHAAEVREQIVASEAERILLLGTSDRMVETIAERLQLPKPLEIIRIEDIASTRAINKALDLRNKENRHVIPIPTFAIKKEFPGYILDPLRSFWGKNHREDPKKVVIERSVVRPIYSMLGNYYISEHVIMQMLTYIASKVPGVSRTGKAEVVSKPDGSVTLQIEVNIFYGENIPNVLREIQQALKGTVEYLTGLTIQNIQVVARRIDIPENVSPQQP